MSYRPKIKTDAEGTVVDLAIDAASLNGNGPAYYLNYNNLSNKPTIPATNVIPATTTANKLLISTTTSRTAKWSDFSTAGLLRTTASGVISVDSNSYVTYITTTIGSDTALYLNAQNHLRVYEDSARIFVPKTEFVDDIDAIYGAYGIQLIDYDDDESEINIKFPFTKSPGTYTMATLEDLSGYATSTHTHGNITNTGTITSTAVTSATGVLVYDSNNKIQRATAANARSIIGAAPTSHTSTATTYGVGTSSSYGHVKVISGDLNGKSATNGYAASQSHTHSQYVLSTDLVAITNSEIDALFS